MSHSNSVSTGISDEDTQIVCCHWRREWTFKWYWHAFSDYLL